MTIAIGTRLGPYEILGPLGAGGMGEVYCARDTRLGRDVAVKVLPSHLASAPEVRARFQREAHTISQLNHPHICTLFDVGHQDGLDYLVLELLEGETLARRLERGPPPVAELLSIGRQIAEALDCAHRAGVAHRDLKPGNVMLTKVGAKLMDFGLARAHAQRPEAGGVSQSPTMSQPLTAEGTIIGTVQYMSPEQLVGQEADARSDIWALGCLLYEMATGTRAFAGESQAALVAAILKDEPRAMAELRPMTPPALERIVKRCLEKDPEERFQSVRDLAFDLEAVSGNTAGTAAVVAAKRVSTRGRIGFVAGASFLLGALLVAAGAFLIARRAHVTDASRLTYTRLTVQRGIVANARFSPDSKTIFYSAWWNGRPVEVFETRPGFPISRAVGPAGTFLQSISGDGMMAVMLGRTVGNLQGTLAEVPISGGAPRRILDDASSADWLPDGKTLAVAHRVGAKVRLEMPPGHALYETAGSLCFVRVSRDGKWVAFAEQPVRGDGRGWMVVLDATGRIAARTAEWNYLMGAAWSADGSELWFCCSRDAASSDLRAITPEGRQRVVARFAGLATLGDVGQNGQALLLRRNDAVGIRGQRSPTDEERELGWFDQSYIADISVDGQWLLFQETGIFGGPFYAVCLRGMDGSSPVRLGEGSACSLSPDGRWALAIHFGPPHRLLLLPTGSGDSTSLPRGNIDKYYDARWLPDGSSIVISASEAGHAQRTYIQDLQGGRPRPLTPEGLAGTRPSPDGRFVAAVSGDQHLYACPTNGGEPKVVAELLNNEQPLQWTPDGRFLYVGRATDSLDVSQIELASGKRKPWRKFTLPDPAGGWYVGIVLTPDGRSYAYTYARNLDDLYLVDGLK
jgi:eukaryotic-like serine/threonine-protein kinase